MNLHPIPNNKWSHTLPTGNGREPSRISHDLPVARFLSMFQLRNPFSGITDSQPVTSAAGHGVARSATLRIMIVQLIGALRKRKEVKNHTQSSAYLKKISKSIPSRHRTPLTLSSSTHFLSVHFQLDLVCFILFLMSLPFGHWEAYRFCASWYRARTKSPSELPETQDRRKIGSVCGHGYLRAHKHSVAIGKKWSGIRSHWLRLNLFLGYD